MTQTRRSVLRLIPMVLLPWLFASGRAASQEEISGLGRIDVSGSLEWVSIYDGDATVGSVSNWGLTGSLSYRSGTPFSAELFLAYSPEDSDPYDLSPQFLISGGWATLSVRQLPASGFDLFFGLGAAYFRVSDWPDFSACFEDPMCFAEGGPNFRNGGAVSVVWGGGFLFRFPGPMTVRGDLKMFSTNRVLRQNAPRIGLGLGWRIHG